MKFNNALLFGLVFFSLNLNAKVWLAKKPWAQKIKDNGAKTLLICGSGNIALTKKSLGRDFFIGSQKNGYVFSDLITSEKYFEVLKTKNSVGAKNILKEELGKASLWVIKKDNTVKKVSFRDVKFHFKGSVKDCFESKKHELGGTCNSVQCCREKFPGMTVSFSDSQLRFRLGYQPDPSITLTSSISKDKTRWCFSTTDRLVKLYTQMI